MGKLFQNQKGEFVMDICVIDIEIASLKTRFVKNISGCYFTRKMKKKGINQWLFRLEPVLFCP